MLISCLGCPFFRSTIGADSGASSLLIKLAGFHHGSSPRAPRTCLLHIHVVCSVMFPIIPITGGVSFLISPLPAGRYRRLCRLLRSVIVYLLLGDLRAYHVSYVVALARLAANLMLVLGPLGRYCSPPASVFWADPFGSLPPLRKRGVLGAPRAYFTSPQMYLHSRLP